MNLEQLEAALRAADAAGDTEAAQMLAREIVRLRAANPASAQGARAPQPAAPAGPQEFEYHAPSSSGRFEFDREGNLITAPEAGTPAPQPAQPSGAPQPGVAPGAEDEQTIRLRATYDAPSEQNVDMAAERQRVADWALEGKLTPEEAQEAYQELDVVERRMAARASGRESVEPMEGFNAAAAAQGYGSGLFGVGTPLSAIGEMIASRFDEDPDSRSWGESLEYARGRRDKLREEHPREFYAGMGSSVVGGAGAARALLAAPKLARAATVFTPQAGQTARNIARIASAGAAAGAVTAANEEGLGEVPEGAALGFGAGAALAGTGVAGRGAYQAVAGRINPDNAALRILSRTIGEPIEDLQRRYNEFMEIRGRPPRLAEIVQRSAREELGQISRVRSDAAGIFRDAAEETERQLPLEMSRQIGRLGTATTTSSQEASARALTTNEARDVVGRRVHSSEVAQVGRRDVSMDRTMQRIGQHAVPVTNDVLEVLETPDVMASLDPALRRRVRAAIEAGDVEAGGTPYLSVAQWDMIRQDLAGRAGPGAGTIYARLRDRVRDHVSAAVPEYGDALREYGRRTDMARGTTAGAKVIDESTRDFVDMIRTAGGGTPNVAQRPGTRVAEQAGARVGARTALADALGGDPAKAENFMERLARDRGMRERVRVALRPDEAAALEDLAARYGHQLNFSTGFSTGRKVLDPNNTQDFRAAMAFAGTPEETRGIRQGVWSALDDTARESPSGALRTASRLADDPGLQSRIAAVLGPKGAQDLRRLGQSVTESTRGLSEASAGDVAQTRAREQAEGIQNVIRAAITATGRWIAGFMGNFTNQIMQRSRLSKGAARKLAQMATDPALAEQVIARLRRAGVKSEEIRSMYRDAAIVAGIQAGRD